MFGEKNSVEASKIFYLIDLQDVNLNRFTEI